jgi:hypothetical protein
VVKRYSCPFAYLIKHYAMKTYGGSGCIDLHFLDLVTSWRWMISFAPRPLYPRERGPCAHCVGGWVDPRIGLDDVERRGGKSYSYPDSKSYYSAVQPCIQSPYWLHYPSTLYVVVHVHKVYRNLCTYETVFCLMPTFPNSVTGLWNRRFPSPVDFIIDIGSTQASQRKALASFRN